jgi:hypothetical protein
MRLRSSCVYAKHLPGIECSPTLVGGNGRLSCCVTFQHGFTDPPLLSGGIYQGVTVPIRKPLLQVQGHSNCDNQITKWRWSRGPDRHRSLETRGTVCSLPWLTCSVQTPFSARLGGGGARKNWWAAGCMPIDLLGTDFWFENSRRCFRETHIIHRKRALQNP